MKRALAAAVLLLAACRQEQQQKPQQTSALQPPPGVEVRHVSREEMARRMAADHAMTPLPPADAPILAADRFADPATREAYAKAAQVADRLDKLYCYCHCHQNHGHRTLRTCFQTDHAAECGICQKEAVQAWADAQQGLPVEATQRAADAAYNQGQPPPQG